MKNIEYLNRERDFRENDSSNHILKNLLNAFSGVGFRLEYEYAIIEDQKNLEVGLIKISDKQNLGSKKIEEIIKKVFLIEGYSLDTVISGILSLKKQKEEYDVLVSKDKEDYSVLIYQRFF